VASRAEEEVTLGSATATAVLNSLDAAVATIPTSLGLEGMRPLADAILQCCSGSSGVSGGNSARLSRDGAAAAGGSGAGGVAVHNQGPSGSHVYQQWKLARACYSWVVSHVLPPADGVVGDAGTWEVQPPLFQQPGLEEVSGTAQAAQRLMASSFHKPHEPAGCSAVVVVTLSAEG
jgi:hypothetical protein